MNRKMLLGVFGLASAFCTSMADSVFAQETNVVTVKADLLDWSGVGDEILAAVTPPLMAGISVALAVWICLTAIRVLKRSAQ